MEMPTAYLEHQSSLPLLYVPSSVICTVDDDAFLSAVDVAKMERRQCSDPEI